MIAPMALVGASIFMKHKLEEDYSQCLEGKAEDPYARSRSNEPVNTKGESDFVLLTGNSNRDLAEKVATRLGTKVEKGDCR